MTPEHEIIPLRVRAGLSGHQGRRALFENLELARSRAIERLVDAARLAAADKSPVARTSLRIAIGHLDAADLALRLFFEGGSLGGLES